MQDITFFHPDDCDTFLQTVGSDKSHMSYHGLNVSFHVIYFLII
jgi:hypothetical protein